jgi:hypothetical protein
MARGFVKKLLLIALLFVGCKTTVLQWELVPVIDSVFDGEVFITSIIYNDNVYEFYSDTEIKNNCYIIFDNGRIIDIRG